MTAREERAREVEVQLVRAKKRRRRMKREDEEERKDGGRRKRKTLQFDFYPISYSLV